MRGHLPAHAVSGGAPAAGGGAGGRDRDDVAPAVGARGGPGVLLGRVGGAVGVAEGESVDAGGRGRRREAVSSARYLVVFSSVCGHTW